MKNIIRIDLGIQTVFIIIIFILLIRGDLSLASALGSNLLCWQALSAIVLLIMNHGRGPRRILFLAGILGYLLSTIASIELITITLPVILIICYWLLTTCNLYPTMKYHRGKFLPHTSF